MKTTETAEATMPDDNPNTYGVAEPDEETLRLLKDRNGEYSDAWLLCIAVRQLQQERDRLRATLAAIEARCVKAKISEWTDQWAKGQRAFADDILALVRAGKGEA